MCLLFLLAKLLPFDQTLLTDFHLKKAAFGKAEVGHLGVVRVEANLGQAGAGRVENQVDSELQVVEHQAVGSVELLVRIAQQLQHRAQSLPKSDSLAHEAIWGLEVELYTHVWYNPAPFVAELLPESALYGHQALLSSQISQVQP